MSTALNKCLVACQASEYLWKCSIDDDIFINSACFQLQQCMEYGLKFLVEMSGNTYRHNHNLDEQITVLEDCGVTEPLLDKIHAKADIYNTWENDARYKENFVAVKSDVEEAVEICKELANLCKSRVTPASIPTEGLEWCRKNAPEVMQHLNDEELWQEFGNIYYKYGKL